VIPPDEAELRREGERIAELIDDLGTIAGAPVRERAHELVQRLVHLYGSGLGRLLQILGGERADADTRARLLADPLVSSLLVLHDIHPAPEAASFDPGPWEGPEPPALAPAGEAGPRSSPGSPGPAGPGRAAGASRSVLVQIDLARSRPVKPEGGP
jgi:hypothetical protein